VATDDLNAKLQQIEDSQKIILEKLNEKKPAKDFWDKFSVVSTFVSSVLVAGVGLLFTVKYNQHQAQVDEALKTQQQQMSQAQLREATVQSVAQFMQYLAGEDNKVAQRKHAVQMLSLMPDKEFAISVSKEFPDQVTTGFVQSVQPKNSSENGKDVAKVNLTGNETGHTILFDGFKNFNLSGFRFSTKKIVPWGTDQPDVEVANPGGANAVLFLEYDAPPYTDKVFPPGKIPANAGITAISDRDVTNGQACPASGPQYTYHYFTVSVGSAYCVRAFDGQHYAKIKITDLEADRIGFDWVYRP
jgi:hypothetical protein